jgi:TPR repeat protein
MYILSELWISGDAVFKPGYGPEQSSDNTRILRSLAEAGNVNLQFKLGKVLEERHDVANAIDWYRKSAANGNRDAAEALERLKRSSEKD